jgi:hypothetical protein
VGAGRTGFSTGVGPVGYYTNVGPSRRRATTTGSVNRQLAAAARQQALADKAAEAQRLVAAFEAILALHRESFPSAQRRVLPPPPEPPANRFRRIHRAAARKNTSVFDRSARRAALQRADQLATRDVDWARAELVRQTALHQAHVDAQWNALVAGDSETVLEALNEAFADNEAAASAVGTDGAEVTLLVLVPNDSEIPERKPATTPAGNLTLKKLTKTETADFYKELVFGHVVVTLREAFAVAPGIQSARIVALRARPRDAYGRSAPEVIAAAHCTRSSLDGVQWDRASAGEVFNGCCTQKLVVQKGATRALQPVPIDEEPGLSSLMAVVDLSDLSGDET